LITLISAEIPGVRFRLHPIFLNAAILAQLQKQAPQLQHVFQSR